MYRQFVDILPPSPENEKSLLITMSEKAFYERYQFDKAGIQINLKYLTKFIRFYVVFSSMFAIW